MKVLITGVAGFIGRHIAIELLEAGVSVFGVDNFDNSDSKIIKTLSNASKKFSFKECDLRDSSSVIEALEGENIDAIIHLAGKKYISESIERPLDYYSTNIELTISVAKIMGKCLINNLIFSSSCTVYGDSIDLPYNELTICGKPLNPYGHSKKIQEDILEGLAKFASINVVSLRYFNPVGARSSEFQEDPRRKHQLFPYIVEHIKSSSGTELMFNGNDYDTIDGTPVRDYIHVVDVANAHICALKYLLKNKTNSSFEVFNIGSGQPHSVLQVIEKFEEALGRKIRYSFGERRTGDVPSSFADTEKQSRTLGFKPRFNFEQMVRSSL